MAGGLSPGHMPARGRGPDSLGCRVSRGPDEQRDEHRSPFQADSVPRRRLQASPGF